MTGKKQVKDGICLDGVNLTIKGVKFTLTMEELRKLSDELAKVIPPQTFTYPVYIDRISDPIVPGGPWPQITWCGTRTNTTACEKK